MHAGEGRAVAAYQAEPIYSDPMNPDEQKEVWLAAYNAALTGALASGRHSETEVNMIAVRAANRAIEEALKKWTVPGPSMSSSTI